MAAREGLLIRAPAKVNLFLRVVGTRPDGYHLLSSLMVPISLYDELRLSVERGRGQVRCRVRADDEDIPDGDDNLAARAAHAVLAETGAAASVSIDIDKRIPAGAGLGGGSSDCAAVLSALPRLLERRIARGRLAEIAVSLGADVPFFLQPRPALASGVGEILRPLETFPRLPLLVVVPPARVNTAWAFRHALSGLTSETPDNTRLFCSRVAPETVVEALHNDFQPGVGAEFGDVPRLLASLRDAGAHGVVMTGTGSAVLGIFDAIASARRAASTFALPDRAFAVRVLRSRPAAAPI